MKTKIYISTDTHLFSLARDITVYFPETHKHPSFFYDIAVNLIGKTFCTHHQDFLNIFGELIHKGTIAHTDVEVIILSTDDEGNLQNQIAKYNEEGYLTENWQLGFFNWSKWE